MLMRIASILRLSVAAWALQIPLPLATTLAIAQGFGLTLLANTLPNPLSCTKPQVRREAHSLKLRLFWGCKLIFVTGIMCKSVACLAHCPESSDKLFISSVRHISSLCRGYSFYSHVNLFTSIRDKKEKSLYPSYKLKHSPSSMFILTLSRLSCGQLAAQGLYFVHKVNKLYDYIVLQVLIQARCWTLLVL